MSTSIQQHQEAVPVGGSCRPDGGDLRDRFQKSWSRSYCGRPSLQSQLFRSADQIRRLSLLAWGFALLALLPHLLCEALASGFVGGPDFPINTYTMGSQNKPSVSRLSDGGFVVTWYGAGQGGDGDDIYGRLYDGSGVAVSSDFSINTFTAGDQQYPSVSGLFGGGFVVTWFGAGQGGDANDIYGRLYDTSGMAVGSDFSINTFTAGAQLRPSVSGLSGGGFVVTWYGARQGGDGSDISGRLYNASGLAVGSDFPINTYALGNQLSPSVADLSGGGFIVTWWDDGQSRLGSDIYGRFYDAVGLAMGSDFLINTYTTGDQLFPSVSRLSGGGFVVTWFGAREGAARDGISGRLYNASGMATGPDLPINAYTTRDQSSPSVSGLSGGGFVVTWYGSGQGGDGDDIYGRLYDAAGMAADSDFPINTYATGNQLFPSVSGLLGGGFVVTWYGAGQGGTVFDISGRLFTVDGTTTTAPPTSQVTGRAIHGQGVTLTQPEGTRTSLTTEPISATTTSLPRGASSTAATSPLTGVIGVTTASMPLSPQAGMDSPGPVLAAGVGAGVAALVCSLLSVLGLVVWRRRGGSAADVASSQEGAAERSAEPSSEEVPASRIYQLIRLRSMSSSGLVASHSDYDVASLPMRGMTDAATHYETPNTCLDSGHSYEMPHVGLDQE